MLNLNHLPPYYGPRMQTRMRERSQKYAWRGTSLDIRTYGRALLRTLRAQTLTLCARVQVFHTCSNNQPDTHLEFTTSITTHKASPAPRRRPRRALPCRSGGRRTRHQRARPRAAPGRGLSPRRQGPRSRGVSSLARRPRVVPDAVPGYGGPAASAARPAGPSRSGPPPG